MNKRNLAIHNYPDSSQFPAEIFPELFEDVDALIRFSSGNAQLGICVASSLISRINRDHRFDTLRYRHEIATELRTAYYVYCVIRSLLVRLSPDRVYVFNGRFSTTLPAVNACEDVADHRNTYFSELRRGNCMLLNIILAEGEHSQSVTITSDPQ